MKNKKYLSFAILTLFLSLSLVACKNETTEIIESNEVAKVSDLIKNIKNKDNLNNKNVREEKNKQSNKSSTSISEDKTKEENLSIKKENSNKKDDKENKDDIKTINIKAFGDLMAHMDQVYHAFYYGKEVSYDFSPQFEYINEFIKDADLAVANFETSVNPERENAGYPRFTSPVDYIKNIKDAGIDMLSTANNHSADSEEKGIYETIKYMDQAGIAHSGTRVKDGDRFIYRYIGNIKIAFLSYTYGINGLESTIESTDSSNIINYLDPELIKEDIEEAKKNKADFVLVYPHWGNEYESYPSQEQIELGRNMIEWGADLVIGNHPHVVQPAEKYKTKDGKEGYIAYSCGNFVSMQSKEGLADIRVEQSVAFDIKLSKNNKTGKTKIENVDFYPIWVGHPSDEYGSYAKIYLTKDFLDGGKYADKVNEQEKERIKICDEMVKETINTKVE